ncbi:hypothetical protein Bbad01_05130 [Bacillus badius]|nr:hypothetical protein Bbad01_05130 [Bacillus badius]
MISSCKRRFLILETWIGKSEALKRTIAEEAVVLFLCAVILLSQMKQDIYSRMSTFFATIFNIMQFT